VNERLDLAPVAWPQTADALGFTAAAADGLRTLDGLALKCEGNWLALVDRKPVLDDPLASQLGAPGLWRVVPDRTGLTRTHDLPPLHGVEEVCDVDGAPSLAALTLFLGWATATRDSSGARDWTPPPCSEVESWLTPARLSVRSGALLARGQLVHEPGRLALVYPDLARVAETLSAARRSWLEDLLLDAQRRWRLVRFGIDAHTRGVRAEVDLTGVPAAWARPCVQLSLEALAWAVEWVLSSLSFLADTSATSQALESNPLHSLNRSKPT